MFEKKFIEKTGEALKKLRVIKELTRQQVADATDITAKTIERIENGTNATALYNIKVLVEYYGLTLSVFFSKEGF